MIIDFHTHIFPDKIAENTIKYMSEKGSIPAYNDGMKSGLLKSANEAGVDLSIILPVVTAPRQFESIHRFAIEINESLYENARLMSFGGIHPESDNYKEELRFIASHGFKGIKIHPDYQNEFIDDIKYKRIISYACELGLAVITHAGFDVGYPELTHCTPDRTLAMLKDVRPENMILAHMGGLNFWEDVEKYLVGENVYFDTAYVMDEMTEEQFVRIIKNHGTDKILFATDNPWKPQKEYVELFKNIINETNGFTEVDVKNILSENALKIIDK